MTTTQKQQEQKTQSLKHSDMQRDLEQLFSRSATASQSLKKASQQEEESSNDNSIEVTFLKASPKK